ncbi:hypothetical protein P3T73_06905 [Kiritimatiellota bacterium B12222]|nr:hypothetical protein P3T73_06905 [Kiritimatiellota bacterium B12222]
MKYFSRNIMELVVFIGVMGGFIYSVLRGSFVGMLLISGSFLGLCAIVTFTSRRKALKCYGYPSSPFPIGEFKLGMMSDYLSCFVHSLNQVKAKKRKTILGKVRTHVLFQKEEQNEDGKWFVEIETCNEEMVSFAVFFESDQDAALNYAKGLSCHKAYFLVNPLSFGSNG